MPTQTISKTLLIALMLTLCVALPVTGAEKPGAPPSKTTSTPIKLTMGVVLPLSGPISPTGNGWARVYKLYFDRLNEKGGIKVGNQSYMVNLVVEDGKTNFEAARTATTKLVHVNGAKFVFGEIMESATEGIYDVTSASGALHIISWINIPKHEADVNIKKPLCIRLSISPEDSIPVLLDDLVKTFPNVKTMVNCSPKIGYDPLDNLLVKMAKDRGINVIAREQWEWGTTDFLPVYTRVLAHKADAVFAMVSAQAHSQLLAARQLGYKGPFLSSSPKGPEEFIRVAGTDACNNVITAGWDGNSPPTATLKEVSQLWTKAYGNEPLLSGTVQAWDSGWVLAQAIERAKSIDPGKVVSAIEAMSAPGSVQTALGAGYIGGVRRFGTNRVLVRPIPLSHLMNGKSIYIGAELPKVD